MQQKRTRVASRSKREGEENGAPHLTGSQQQREYQGRRLIGRGNDASLIKIFDQPLTTDTFSSPSKTLGPDLTSKTRTLTASSSATTHKEDIAPTNGKSTPITGILGWAANMKRRGFVPRNPRSLHSRVIARLGEKRAAAAAASSTSGTNPGLQPSATSKRMRADLGGGRRVRSNLGKQSLEG